MHNHMSLFFFFLDPLGGNSHLHPWWGVGIAWWSARPVLVFNFQVVCSAFLRIYRVLPDGEDENSFRSSTWRTSSSSSSGRLSDQGTMWWNTSSGSMSTTWSALFPAMDMPLSWKWVLVRWNHASVSFREKGGRRRSNLIGEHINIYTCQMCYPARTRWLAGTVGLRLQECCSEGNLICKWRNDPEWVKCRSTTFVSGVFVSTDWVVRTLWRHSGPGINMVAKQSEGKGENFKRDSKNKAIKEINS